jgi:hypothetical protein
LPTFLIPFDFVDDGALVYADERPFPERVAAHTQHDFRTNGTFRPIAWAHWDSLASAGDVLWIHRAARWLHGVLCVVLFLWLLAELDIPTLAAWATALLAFWNPLRNEIWLGLGLTEAFAMPYAYFALIAAIRGARTHSWRWDLAGFIAALLAIETKNTFVAIVPAQLLLRLGCANDSWSQNIHRCWPRLLFLSSSVFAVLAQMVAYKLDPAPKNYVPKPPQMSEFGAWIVFYLRAIGIEYVLLAIVCWTFQAARYRPSSPSTVSNPSVSQRYIAIVGLVLALAGIAVYLPFGARSGRYAVPGVWGLDLWMALFLTKAFSMPEGLWKRAGATAFTIGLVVSLAVIGIRQDQLAARTNFLWQPAHYLESHAQNGATVLWQCGTGRDDLSLSEGLHFQWHLARRQRTNVILELKKDASHIVETRASYALTNAAAAPAPGWQLARTFETSSLFGRRKNRCYLWAAPAAADALAVPNGLVLTRQSAGAPE